MNLHGHTSRIFSLPLAALLALGSASAGCSDNSNADDDAVVTPDAAPGAADAATPTPDADPEGWTELVGGDWELAPHTEGYYCATKIIHEKTFVGAFRPIAPVGTHHTVVSYGPADGATDDPGSRCSAGVEKPNWIYASGVGTEALVLPEGVGMVLDVGQAVHVNLHLFNTSDVPISGHSGVQIKKLVEANVQHEADIILAGPAQFSIPGGMQRTITGTCPITSTQTVFALFPHMHQIGRHIKTTIVPSAGSPQVLWDEDYNFESQPFFVFAPVQLTAGDKITTTCTYENTSQSTVSFGQSSTDEMCFSIIMRYPRQTANQQIGFPLCWDFQQ